MIARSTVVESHARYSSYVVQEVVDLCPQEFPIFNETEWRLQRMFVDTNPFLFGGGETGFFVIQERGCGLRLIQSRSQLTNVTRVLPDGVEVISAIRWAE
jgi:hypothetical protein